MKTKLFALMKVASIFVMLGLIPPSLFATFIPVEFLQGRYWKWPALVMGIALTVLLRRRNRRLGRPTDMDGGGHVLKVFMFLGMPVMMGFLSWLFLAKAIPWGVTLLVGTTFEEAYLMQTYHQSKSDFCEYQLRGGPIDHAFPDHLCIKEELYLRYPEQQIAVTLKGQRSVLGARVTEIYGPQ
ncbi:hypothetical protein [Xanthomonas sp. 3793]|uniref:Transmembrane protein n=1 Tax=Xanthomonas sp. 10-10 TaxID=3115848 RepID=A0AAU7PCZ5_9XANT|nr:hypothetical protein [Xanthomonas sp. 3793]MCS3745733.1 hypothetical protein [Xanthomonas sp. 3793]